MGGGAVANDAGFSTGGTILGTTGAGGTPVTNEISISAGSMGVGRGEQGIVFAGGSTVQVGDGGTIALFGTGGGLYNSPAGATQNFGVSLNSVIFNAGNGGSAATTIDITGIGGSGAGGANDGVIVQTGASFNLNNTNPASSVNFINCVGGNGGKNNRGVSWQISTTMTNGALNFRNCVGGSGGTAITGHHGVFIAAGISVIAPTIIAVDCYGGPGTINNNGFLVNGGHLGSSATNLISISAGSLGLDNNEIGIQLNTSGTNVGSMTVGDGGTITLIGTGGGLYNNSVGGNNYGVNLSGCVLTAGNGGTPAVSINITGIGGNGYMSTTDNSHGVNIATSLAVNLNSTSGSNSLNFLNCIGGNGGGVNGGSNYGVNFGVSLILADGALNFRNCTGGTGGSGNTNHNGVVINTGIAVSAPAIIATDCLGGPGTGSDRGFYINGGTLGSSATNEISITAGSLGTGSNETGIRVDTSGIIQVGNGGTITLNGTGGGFYNGTGANNYGVNLNGATLSAGNGGTFPSTINITGIGGHGSGGSNYGVTIATSLAVNLNNTSPYSALNFINCVGGIGGNANFGVNITAGFTLVNGALNFQNCVGGSGGNATNHHGVTVNGVAVSAPTIIATDCLGGPGINGDIGFFIQGGGTVGSSSTGVVIISAGSLGTGGSEDGIQISGGSQVIVGDGGLMTLTGVAGGSYNGSGGSNVGVNFAGCTLTAGNGGTAATTINVTGIGGFGSIGGHFGVDTQISFAVNLNNTNSASSINFINCVGGSQGAGNAGVFMTTPLIMQNGLLNFTNCEGGAGAGGAHFGVDVNVSGTVSAPVIIVTDCFGGNGGAAGGDVGFVLRGGSTLGTTGSAGLPVTNLISIRAGCIGTSSNELGILCNNTSIMQVGNGGTIGLAGIGGGAYNGTGSGNIGIQLLGVTFTAGNGGTAATTISLTGIGGLGSGGSHNGVNIGTSLAVNLNTANASSAFNFTDCIGGTGGNGNNGVSFATNFTLVNGSLNFLNVVGGGTSGSSSNFGVNINGVTVTAPVIIGRDLVGGPGSGNNYGLNIGSATTPSQLGSSSTNVLTMTATSLGLGSNEYGINIFGTGGTSSVVVGNGGTLTLTGSGGGTYSSAGTLNHGIYLNNAVLTSQGSAATTMNLTGLGGQGSGGTNAGLYIDTLGLTVKFGSSNSNQLNFLNCIGGFVGSNNYGIGVFGPVTTNGTGATQFLNATGGGNGVGTNNDGLHFAANYSAPDIFAEATGGYGFGTVLNTGNTGVFVASGFTLGGPNSNQIHLTGSSLGTGSFEFGIDIDAGTVQVGTGGTISLRGNGGGTYNGSGSNNYGVELQSATLATGTGGTINFSGYGGSGSGGSNYGVNVDLNVTDPIMNFTNLVGGSGGNNNYGVNFATPLIVASGQINFLNVAGGGTTGSSGNNGVNVAATVSAPVIIAQDVFGGPGVSMDIGFNIAANFGSSATTQISITAGSIGTGNSEYGIQVASGATVQVGDGGTIALIGTGGGTYTGFGSFNYGVNLNGATLTAGNGGSPATTITVTGIGGSGGSGFNNGVNIATSFAVNLNNTNSGSSLNFTNCIGGTGNGSIISGSQNYGVIFTTPLALANGALNFRNCVGGTGAFGGNHGVFVELTTVSAPSIIATDCLGGPGFGNTGSTFGDFGFGVNGGTLGSSGTFEISISGGSLGVGSGEVGIQIRSSTVQVGDGGTITFNGTGGGLYTGTGTSNDGVQLFGATLTAGTGGSGLATINITGVGGSGSSNNRGAATFSTSGGNFLHINLNSTNSANAVNFINCMGGHGAGGSNIGAFLGSPTIINGPLNLTNCVGGSGGGSNNGVETTNTVTAPTIIATDCLGGPGTGSDIGFYAHGGTVSAANLISITAGSLGTGSLENGIRVDASGKIIVGDGGTIALIGSGGGLYNGTGATNYGVNLNGATLTAGNGGSPATAINVTGIGGHGTAGSNFGVNIATSLAVNLNNTNSTSALNFTNCIGGTGGTSSNIGVNFATGLALVNGSLNFNNVVGGGTAGSTNNYGVNIGAAVTAPVIIGRDLVGGPGTNNNWGLNIAAQLGSAATNVLQITASSIGMGSFEYGINMGAPVVVASGASMNLTGSAAELITIRPAPITTVFTSMVER